MSIVGIFERDGPWYVVEHRLVGTQGHVGLDMGRSDWADWSQTGELLFAREGRIYRVVIQGKSAGAPKELIDLRDLKFEAIAAPPEATQWEGRAPRGKKLRRSGQ